MWGNIDQNLHTSHERKGKSILTIMHNAQACSLLTTSTWWLECDTNSLKVHLSLVWEWMYCCIFLFIIFVRLLASLNWRNTYCPCVRYQDLPIELLTMLKLLDTFGFQIFCSTLHITLLTQKFLPQTFSKHRPKRRVWDRASYALSIRRILRIPGNLELSKDFIWWPGKPWKPGVLLETSWNFLLQLSKNNLPTIIHIFPNYPLMSSSNCILHFFFSHKVVQKSLGILWKSPSKTWKTTFWWWRLVFVAQY